MQKIVLILFFLILASFLFSETIIDSVYSDPILDGYIKYSQNSNTLSVNNYMYHLISGDGGGNFINPDHNSYYRGFISFELPGIPIGYFIDSVYVKLYQYYSTGNGYDDYFPEWDVANGDTVKCIMSHIDYGDELDVGDWQSGDHGNPNTNERNIGIVTDEAAEGYRYLNVTNSVINDYEADRGCSQYRIAFEINTDWDNDSDNICIKTSNSSALEHRPLLNISYTNEVNNINDNLIIQAACINNYPNPFNPQTTISYSIVDPGNVQLQIYNIIGQLIETLVDEMKGAGDHTVEWNAESQASGIYLYRITTAAETKTGRCLLLK